MKKQNDKLIYFKSFLVSVLVIVFFAAIISVYYTMLVGKTRGSIRMEGEFAAKRAEAQFEDYFSASLNIISLSAYELDVMITEQKSNAELQSFLVAETEAIQSVVDKASMGLYGYINGVYLDGSNWIPPTDFIATERPWYKLAIENAGNIAVSEPYLDLLSESKMFSLSKTLCDGVSVISLDLSLDRLQKLTEEAVSSGGSTIEMILDDKGGVVTHSDRGELEKNYGEEEGTLGAAIVGQLKQAAFFELAYHGSRYHVYAAKLQNGWHCVSVIDATSVFRALNIMLGATIAVVIVVALIIGAIMAKSRERGLLAERSGAQVSSLAADIHREKQERDRLNEEMKANNYRLWTIADMFTTVYEISLTDDTFTMIKSDSKFIRNLSGCHALETMRKTMEILCNPSFIEEVQGFLDFSTLDRRLHDSSAVTLEYMDYQNLWRRLQFIASRHGDNGCLTHVILLNASIDKEKRERDRLHNQIASLADIYRSVYEIDIIGNKVVEIFANNKNIFNLLAPRIHENVRRSLPAVMEQLSAPVSKEDIRLFLDFSTLNQRMENRNTLTLEFLNIENLWLRGRFIISQRTSAGTIARVLWLVENIDEEKRKRDQLVDMSERAIAASEAKSAFLSNMSHEIRTPINAVLGLNEMILRESGDTNILAYAESIRTAGSALLGIINDILDFSKIEAGKMEIIPVDYELSSILNDLVNMIQTRADDKGLTLKLDFDESTPGLLNGDEVRIKQVITNILTNAVKYTEKGTVTFHVGYERIADEPDNMYLTVSVKDTGIGMKQEDLKKLFSEFERIEEKRNRNIEGTGLGMSITRNLLEMMGTSLQVESVYGEGSTFSFRVKQRVIRWTPIGNYEAAYRASLKDRKKYKEKFTAPNAVVLVVDDTPMNLMVFKSLLSRTQVQIDMGNSGDEGLAMAYDKKYDIIFLDHMMPEKDGIETLHEMRTQVNNPNLQTPVVCLTANAISGAREKYLAEGFNDYLTKPIDSAKLEEMLMKYLPEEKIHRSTAGDEPALESAAPEFPPELEALNGQDWIDIRAGMKNSGSVEAYLPLLQIFYTSLDEKADEIERFYMAGDYQNYTIKVHAIKSSARIIGAAAFGEEAQLLENAGKSEDLDYIREHHNAFIEELRSFKEPLSKIFTAEEGESDKPEADADMMADVFEEIRAAADDMDCDRLQDVFTEMGEYRVPAEYAALWDALSEASGKYDYDGILELLERNA